MCLWGTQECALKIIIKYLFYTTVNQSIVFANLLFNIYRLGQYAALRFYFIRAYHCDSPPGGALPTLGSSDQVQDTLMGLSDFFTQELPTQVTRVRVSDLSILTALSVEETHENIRMLTMLLAFLVLQQDNQWFITELLFICLYGVSMLD